MGSGGQWWAVVGSGSAPLSLFGGNVLCICTMERDGLADQTNYPTVLCSWSCDVGVLWTECT